jgi:FMN phosphatase YigB (HAD superfamily)
MSSRIVELHRMPKAILFDLDDTLTDRKASLDRYVAQLIADLPSERRGW